MPVQVGPRIRISDFNSQRAKEQGCEFRLSINRLVTPSGFQQIDLFNPANRARFDVTDYDDDEFMLGSEIDAARRRLNIMLP